MEDLLTIDELCKRTKYARQSVYNMINKKIFLINQHYYKPTPKKILFKSSAIETWLSGGNVTVLHTPVITTDDQQVQKKEQFYSKINI